MAQQIQETHSIKKLVEDVDSKHVTLPEFQRDFVWEIGKTFDLFDSIVKDIFIGAIIYGIPSFEITTRELDARPRKTKGKRRTALKTEHFSKEQIGKLHALSKDKFRLILDGQQRTTSIYRALKGIDEIWFIAKNEEELSVQLQGKKVADISLEDYLYEFDAGQDEDRISIKLSDVWDIMINDYFDDEKQDKFFSPTSYYQKYKDSQKFNARNAFRKYLGVVKKIQNLLQADKLLSFYKLDMSLDKFVLFFERSNNRGIQLSFIDILTAKLYNKFKLRKKRQEFEKNHSNYKLNIVIIVRAIAYLVSSELAEKDNKSIEIHKAFILSELNADHFNMWWDEAINWYVSSLDFLYNNNFIVAQSWIPYETMLIPMMIFRKELGKPFSSLDQKQSNFFHYWFWASIFSQRYTGSTNERIIKDSVILTQIAKNESITNNAFFNKISKSQISNLDDIYSYNRKQNPIYKGILNLIAYNAKGLYDWKNTNKVSFNHDKLEDHHIYPKSYIAKTNKETSAAVEKINCVANRALIPKLLNIKIRAQAPSIYLNEIKQSNPNLENSLSKHSITGDTLTSLLNGELDNEYLFFIELRAEEIFKLIDKNVLQKSSIIRSTYYKEPQILNDNIKIYASHYKKDVTATFNPKTKTINYNNSLYSSISDAARQAKKDMGGDIKDKDINGWLFWKYKKDNVEHSLSKLKRMLFLN